MRGRPGAEVDAGEESPEDLRSRGDDRRDQKKVEEQLMQLGVALVELGDKMLLKMDLPDEVLEVVESTRRIRELAPRSRSLRLVRIALRGVDWKPIQERLRDLHEAPRAGAAKGPLEDWRDRLVTGGEEALSLFLSAFPGADRRQIRQLARNARSAKEASRAEALRALTKILRSSLA